MIKHITEFEYRRSRSNIIFLMRSFFHKRTFIEVETPSLSSVLIPERHIEVFDIQDDKSNKQYLVPSPEIHLKPLLAQMAQDYGLKQNQKNPFVGVFEFAHSFRKNEIKDDIHGQEFFMLEWYELHKNIMQTKQTCIDLILYIIKNADGFLQDLLPVWLTQKDTVKVMSMKQAFAQFAKVDLTQLVCATSVEEACSIAKLDLKKHAKTYDWEDVFNHVFVKEVEPNIPLNTLCFISDYPARIATLAAVDTNGADVFWAKRWELYAGNMEIANCYCEETNPANIKIFFDDQNNQTKYKNKGIRKNKVKQPEDFLKSPPLPMCSGVALGVDRFITLFLGPQWKDSCSCFRRNDGLSQE